MIILWLACLVVIVLVVGFWLSSTAKPESETPILKKGSQSMSKKEKQPKQPKAQPKEQQQQQQSKQRPKERTKVEPIAESPAEKVAVVSIPTKKNKKSRNCHSSRKTRSLKSRSLH